MARALRIEFPGAIYHVMSRGIDGRRVFGSSQDFLEFLKRVGTTVKKGLLIMHAYCLMPNHYHFLCETPIGALRRIMQWILGGYAQWYNWRHQRHGYLWQGRYRAILVQDGPYLLHVSCYLHLNPCPSIVSRPEQYRWSSYRNYVGGDVDVTWVTTDKVLAPFNTRDEYRRFVEGHLNLEITDPFQRATAGVFYGDDAFFRKVLRLVRDVPDHLEIPSLTKLRALAPQPDPEYLRGVVRESFSDWSKCQQNRMLMYLLDEYTSLSLTEVGRWTDRTTSGVSKAVRDIRRQLKSDHRLASRVEILSLQFANLLKD
jgi:REP element-mobilizing transposase RayT